MSFDRLEPDISMRGAITVRAVAQGKFQALWVPPVFTTEPTLAERLLHIEEMAEAIDRNPEIDQGRKNFIKRRIRYRKEWLLLRVLGYTTRAIENREDDEFNGQMDCPCQQELLGSVVCLVQKRLERASIHLSGLDGSVHILDRAGFLDIITMRLGRVAKRL